MTPVERFVVIQRELDEHLRSERFNNDHPLQKEFDVVILAEFKKRFPRRKFDKLKASKLMPDYAEIAKPFNDRATKLVDDFVAKRKALEEALNKAAEACEITADMKIADKALWTRYDGTDENTYRSQGFGAIKYAEQAAQGYVDELAFHGIEAEVRLRTHAFKSCSGENCSWQCFDVYAGATQLGCDIARHKPSMTVREWVRLCWKRGVNPRVYNPFLPTGFEEKVGLDYFGNDLKKQEVASAP